LNHIPLQINLQLHHIVLLQLHRQFQHTKITTRPKKTIIIFHHPVLFIMDTIVFQRQDTLQLFMPTRMVLAQESYKHSLVPFLLVIPSRTMRDVGPLFDLFSINVASRAI
uniref:Secreted protein n=1 Tax=Angiostrongylus cantonensis TaxID=6313 RepID=A0A0K0DIX5_ANGCA